MFSHKDAKVQRKKQELALSETYKFEFRILCGAVTDVRKDTHVEEREWFVQGVG